MRRVECVKLYLFNLAALHTICGNNTSIVLSFWWWAYKCPKHADQIINAIKHSVTSSWFSSLRLYNDARTNIHQMSLVLFNSAVVACTRFYWKPTGSNTKRNNIFLVINAIIIIIIITSSSRTALSSSIICSSIWPLSIAYFPETFVENMYWSLWASYLYDFGVLRWFS